MPDTPAEDVGERRSCGGVRMEGGGLYIPSINRLHSILNEICFHEDRLSLPPYNYVAFDMQLSRRVLWLLFHRESLKFGC